ncbi:response regulator [Candidatus Sumerlaeota bacterium]|nr:response regulator [Candidatus Sumerlaeota bacterium]
MKQDTRVLLLEDNPGDADLICDMLSRDGVGGFEIRRAERLADAIACLKNWYQVDLAIVDLGLPDSAGLDTLQSIRRAAPDIPVVVLTGNDDEATGIAAVQQGAEDYLVKGLIPAQLLPRVLRHAVQRHLTKDRLRESEEKYRGMVDNIGMGVVLISPRMEILEMNRRMRQWFPDVSLGSRPICYRTLRVPPLDRPCDDCPAVSTLKYGVVHETTAQIAQGEKTVIHRIVSSPVRDAQDRIVAAIEMVEDVTERVSLEQQLRRAQRMEAVGQLAGGVAHDFNNVLQAIVGFAEMAGGLLKGGEEPAGECLAEILKGTRRAALLTRQLLTFSRRQILTLENLDLNEVVSGLMKMLNRVIGEHIRIEFRPGSELGTVCADRGQMEQVLLNLCINARDAMFQGGQVTIRTENVAIDGEHVKPHAWARPGRYVQLRVADTGCGMDAETLSKVFDPFFTTKRARGGTGLGLATVHSIVCQHEGVVRCLSEPGKGAVVEILLPLVERPAIPAAEKIPGPVRGGNETVLVAEDDETVRKVIRRILEGAGYTVVLATNGKEAIRLFGERGDDLDLAVLDVVMPELGGRAVHGALSKKNPDFPFLFLSGYSASSFHAAFILEEGMDLIQKPFVPDDLLRKIRAILDGRVKSPPGPSFGSH